MINYISHIQSPLTEQDCNLFIEALSKKGNEATAFVWINWYFDFKKDPKNEISTDFHEKITEAVEKNKIRIFNAIRK